MVNTNTTHEILLIIGSSDAEIGISSLMKMAGIQVYALKEPIDLTENLVTYLTKTFSKETKLSVVMMGTFSEEDPKSMIEATKVSSMQIHEIVCYCYHDKPEKSIEIAPKVFWVDFSTDYEGPGRWLCSYVTVATKMDLKLTDSLRSQILSIFKKAAPAIDLLDKALLFKETRKGQAFVSGIRNHCLFMNERFPKDMEIAFTKVFDQRKSVEEMIQDGRHYLYKEETDKEETTPKSKGETSKTKQEEVPIVKNCLSISCTLSSESMVCNMVLNSKEGVMTMTASLTEGKEKVTGRGQATVTVGESYSMSMNLGLKE